MADTIEVIAAQLRAQYPYPQTVTVNGVSRDMTQEEYDAWISAQAVAVREAQLAAEAEAQEAEIRRLTRLALTKLDQNYQTLSDTSVTLTVPQMRAMLADVTRAAYFVVRILKRAHIIEDAV